ncbi:hypothetical protein JZ751_013634 [Albula glossodonta]|uniref:Uncharacterized protein n=1 Tax=Albula glossodonta TaxID=121402 RepID=A0A8T2P1E3_9TELE|nr:hypothetical protein JZ751_013634 [Albula glossodonta]
MTLKCGVDRQDHPPLAGLGARGATLTVGWPPHSLGLDEEEEEVVRGELRPGRGEEHSDLDWRQDRQLSKCHFMVNCQELRHKRKSIERRKCFRTPNFEHHRVIAPCLAAETLLARDGRGGAASSSSALSRREGGVEKHRSSCGPECRVRGRPFLRRPPSDARCFLFPSRPLPDPVGAPLKLVSLKGLCTEFQRTSSFLGLEEGPWAGPEVGPWVGPEAWVGPELWAAAATANDDWWEGLPIMVMEKGSSGDSKMAAPRSLSFWDEEEEEAPEAEDVFFSPWETEKGSPPPRPSRVRRGRAGGAQGSGEGVEAGGSISGAGPRPKAGKPLKKAGSSSGAGLGERGPAEEEDHTPTGSSCSVGVRPGEGSRKADRKGSGARPRPVDSLLCAAVTDGQAAQPVGSGEGPSG